MRKINITSLLFFILFLTYSNLSYANFPFFSDPHDSLSFDGSGEINTTAEDCSFEIVVIGQVEAMVRTKVPSACEDEGEGAYTWTRKAAKTGDIIKAGEEIVTGPGGYVKIILSDGSYMVVDENSKFTPDNKICDQLQSRSGLRMGSLWTKIKRLVGGGKFEVSAQVCAIGVRGTEFAVETDANTNVIKVYEGSVEVRPTTVISSIEGKAEKLEKLAKEFEEGKISLEEYSQKMMEISSEVQKDTELMEIIVEAGNKLTINKDGTITGPEPIGTDDERWWEIIP